ncbi:MAG: HopJ type III effector protein [Sphingobacteriales bacterium]|jgi:hypothetical protein|nr:MAG: HopJ type III effector protein [Sphingobacteriales bacterium]
MLLDKIQTSIDTIQFDEVISFIDQHYDFTPTKFINGKNINEINQNNGSCKIFYFAKIHNLSNEQTLQLFGDYYRKDVLEHPEKEDHQNIRNFIQFGWNGISFDGVALSKR